MKNRGVFLTVFIDKKRLDFSLRIHWKFTGPILKFILKFTSLFLIQNMSSQHEDLGGLWKSSGRRLWEGWLWEGLYMGTLRLHGLQEGLGRSIFIKRHHSAAVCKVPCFFQFHGVLLMVPLSGTHQIRSRARFARSRLIHWSARPAKGPNQQRQDPTS